MAFSLPHIRNIIDASLHLSSFVPKIHLMRLQYIEINQQTINFSFMEVLIHMLVSSSPFSAALPVKWDCSPVIKFVRGFSQLVNQVQKCSYTVLCPMAMESGQRHDAYLRQCRQYLCKSILERLGMGRKIAFVYFSKNSLHGVFLISSSLWHWDKRGCFALLLPAKCSEAVFSFSCLSPFTKDQGMLQMILPSVFFS